MTHSVIDVIEQGMFSTCHVTLNMPGAGECRYQCTKSFRLLPGRRLTALASCENKQYVVKIFSNTQRAQAEFSMELTGYDLLQARSYVLPERLYHGAANEGVNIIVYQYVSQSRTLSDVFKGSDSQGAGRKHLMQLIELVARLHKDGLIHEDPHLENFLVKDKDITVLDYGAVRQVQNEHLHSLNLALFVAQFPKTWHVEPLWLDTYLASQGRASDDVYRHALLKLIKRQQDTRERRFLKKIYRQCTDYDVRSSLYGRIVYRKDAINAELLERISDIQGVFDGDHVNYLKQGRSSTVAEITAGNECFVVKRYNVKHIGHRIKHTLRESRASRSWRNSHLLVLRGLATAEPVAMVECVKGRHKGVSLFVMRQVAGITSDDYFRQDAVTVETKNEVAIHMLKMLGELAAQGIVHGDLKSTNFIIRNDRPVLVDLDAMKVIKNVRALVKGVNKDRARFRENWMKEPEIKSIFDLLMDAKADH